MEDSGEVLELEFGLTVATTPFRIPNAPYPIMQHGKICNISYYLIESLEIKEMKE